MSETKQGVFGKYVIEKADGSPVDSEACYFVLRLDSDEAARKAMLTYAEHCGNEKLAKDIERCVASLDTPPCGCRSVDECYHNFLGDLDVWRHGSPETFETLPSIRKLPGLGGE